MIYTNEIYGFEVEYGFEKLDNGLIVIKKPSKDNKYIIKYLALPPTFEILSNALNDSAYINHITGKPFALASVLYKHVFEHAIIEVQFVDNSEMESFKVGVTNISQLHYNLIKIIVQHWLKQVL